MYGQIQATDRADVWCGERRVRTPDSASCPRGMSSAVPKPKLLDQLREARRSRHYNRRTEETYRHWIRRFIHSHHDRHLAQMAEPEINAFPTHLAVMKKVSASTQTQALSALLFLYRHVIGREVGDLRNDLLPCSQPWTGSGFAARSMRLGRQVLMPLRIRRHNKSLQGAQAPVAEIVPASLSGESAAC